jgi:septal ring factor EnvC (AmiA/AmiB activator)
MPVQDGVKQERGFGLEGLSLLCYRVPSCFKSLPSVPHRIMDDAGVRSARALLGDMREELRRELGRLADKRKNLETQLEALGKELKGVDVELNTKRRTLALLEATEQQLANQKPEGSQESGPAHSSVEAGAEVRRVGFSRISHLSLTYAPVVTAHASGSP